MSRRPPPRRLGAFRCAAVCAACLLTVTGCSGELTMPTPAVTGRTARACAALEAALPHRVAEQDRRQVRAAPRGAPGEEADDGHDKGHGYAAAWGDPAIELRCGVPRPKGFTRFSGCQVADGVGWYIPESQQTGRPVAITMTTIGRAENVEVRVPQRYFPPVATMVDLAPALKRAIPLVRPCV
jgi:hypothetical protein